MALLAKGGNNFSDEFKQVSVNTELLVCPTCGREVPPWIAVCPDDGTPVLAMEEISASGPAVPSHLLDDLEAADAAATPDDAVSTEPAAEGDAPESANGDRPGDDRELEWPG